MSEATLVLAGDAVDVSQVGGKAFALNRLLQIGVRVPPAGSVTTHGYRWFVRHSGLDDLITELRARGLPEPAGRESEAERVDAAFLAASMPSPLEEEIRRLGEVVRGGGRLAVRSSATAEDLAKASFAGQYRSLLGIGDDAALLRAVRLVWASLWHPAPRSYRLHRGVAEDDVAMSVVVMRLVEAERAGVVFTVDPSGDGTQVRVEAVEGLGEQLVSGAVTPEVQVVARVEAHRRRVDPVIDEVVATALGIERSFGQPQDVEWAHDGLELFVVQSRPITTLSATGTADGFDTPIARDDTYTTAGIAETVPGVLPPLQWSTAAPLLENAFRRLFDQMGALPPLADHRPFLARVRGRAVLSLDLLKAAALEVPGGSIEEIERQYFGRVLGVGEQHDVRERSERGPFMGLRRMVAGFREINARRRFRFEAHASIDAVERLLHGPPDCGTVSTERLVAYRHRCLDLADRLMSAEVAAAASAAAAYRGVELSLAPHLGADASRLAQQLTAGGVNPCGAQVALHACDLADQALTDRELSAALAGLTARQAAAREVLARTSRGRKLIADVDAELSRAGSTSVFSGETWAESEDLAWQVLSQAVQVGRSGRPQMASPSSREDLLRAVEARFRGSWKYRVQRVMTGQVVDVRHRMLRRLVADAVEFLHLREKSKSAVLALGGEVRRVHLAIGRRLVISGALDDPADVDLFAAYELEPALAGAGPGAWELRRRRDVLARLGDAGPIAQVFTGDPAGGRTEAVTVTDSFVGWPASGGVYEGPARVITRAADPIAPGEILVARTTDPAWIPLFLTAGAVVVEEGGPLSHAAIIARELQLPAVLNVPGLVARVAAVTDARLRVDGDRGTVTIVGEPAGEAAGGLVGTVVS